MDRISDEVKGLLAKLRLKKMYSCTILKYDKDTANLLNLIEAYITWGFVNKKAINDLVHKRGTFLGEDKAVNELDNTLIENHLGKHNILCIDDIVHELATCGKGFNEAIKFLGFFLLSPSEDVKDKVNINFSKGGNQGFRADKINDLLKKMI